MRGAHTWPRRSEPSSQDISPPVRPCALGFLALRFVARPQLRRRVQRPTVPIQTTLLESLVERAPLGEAACHTHGWCKSFSVPRRAAQAMSMVTRFDSSFLCRLGASVERLHHLARPSREEAMHRAHSDVCTRHRMPCCTCCSQQIWIDLSLHQVVEARFPAAQASWYDPGEDRTGPNRARYSFKLGAKGHLAHTTL